MKTMSETHLQDKMAGFGGITRYLPQIITLLIIICGCAVMFPGYLHVEIANGRLYGSLIDILNRGAPVALLSIGMTLVIATKGIDLSVGAVMAIAGAVAASSVESSGSVTQAITLALAAGLACGLWNGALVAFADVQPFIATLILMVAGRGIAQLITAGHILTFNNPGLAFFGSGTILTIPTPVVLWIAGAALAMLVVRKTALGMLIEAIGINRRAASVSGVNSKVLLIACYMICGLGAGVAGIVAAADIKGADANNAGLNLELDAILAVVMGGTSLLGGRFTLLGSLLGAMIIQSINTGILMSGLPSEFNLVIKAVIIILILFIQSPALRVWVADRRQRRQMSQAKVVVKP